MDKKVVILSGMPASGKDTISDMICEKDKRFVPFKKHRSVGEFDKIKDTYYNISHDEFEEKITNGDFIQYHQRYGRYYGISEEVLLSYLEKDEIPIIHIGRIENYIAFQGNIVSFQKKHNLSLEVIHIQLWETAENLRARIVNREKNDDEAAKRIAAMVQEFDDNIELMRKGKKPYTLILKNSEVNETCATIIKYVDHEPHEVVGYDEFWGYLKKLEKKKDRIDLSSLALADETEKKRDWTKKTIPNAISGIKFDGVVILKNTKTDSKKLNLDHCFFEYINIKEESEEIRTFRFVSCKIEQVRFFNCETDIHYADCYIDKLILDGRSKIAKLDIEGCSVGTIILEKGTTIDRLSITGDSNVNMIDCRDGDIGNIVINNSKVEYIRINHKVGNISLGNGASLERFSIEKEHAFKEFTKALKEKRKIASKGTFSEKIAEAQCQKSIFLAALSQYGSDHKFDEADLCLVNLRSIECAIKRIESRNIFIKAYHIAENFIVGGALGWGVKISNTLLTAVIMMLVFASIFYYKISDERSLLGCVKVSIENFFNLNSSEIIPRLGNLDLLEQIVGVIMLTIFTGVIVRKIIK